MDDNNSLLFYSRSENTDKKAQFQLPKRNIRT